jgi:glycosyltransferase involved in cell wall biosynthesis
MPSPANGRMRTGWTPETCTTLRILISADPILHVPPRLYGGIERVIASLCAMFGSLGHRVGLIALEGSGARVDRLYPWAGGPGLVDGFTAGLHRGDTLTRAVRDFRPDVVHSFSRLAYLGRHLLSGLPKVMSYQRIPTARTTRWAARLAGRRLKFTGCSEFIAGLGRANGGDWRAIPNFVDADRFPFKERVEDSAPLVFLSRIERIKGAHNAIQIARRAGRKLIIAGNRVESAEAAAYWRTEIEPHLAAGQVEYVGPVDDEAKAELLGDAAAMVVPIEWDEPFGIVFAEALACGTPVISARRGAVPEIIRDGVEGFLVSSAEEGAVAVARLASISRRACRERVMARFSLPVVARQYLDLYDEVCAQP